MIVSMLKRFKYRLRDTGTLAQLFKRAEIQAKNMGLKKVGAEHLMLASLELPDGTAKQLLDKLGVTQDQLQEMIKKMHQGLVGEGIDDSVARVSTQKLMSRLVKFSKANKTPPLLAKHIFEVMTEEDLGLANQVLANLDIDQEKLKSKLQEEFYPLV